MLDIVGRSVRLCDGVSRRGFLRVGSLGAAGLTLPHVLRARQAQAASDRKETSVILLYQAGGASHIDMYDMKPLAVPEVRGPFSPIATNLPGFDVCELMPRHARIADRLAIIRSIKHHLAVHDDGTHWLQTGWPLLNARQAGQRNPAQGSVISALAGPRKLGMPAYVAIPEDYRRHMGFYEGPAFLHSRHAALDAGGDPSLGNYRPPDFKLPADVVMSRLEDRRGLWREFDTLSRRLDTEPQFQSLDDVQRQALELVSGSTVRQAFDLSQEAADLRDRYGRHGYGQQALLARRLVEAGVTFVVINLYEKDVDWWDDHYTIEKNLRKRLPVFDQALTTLIEDLSERGMLDHTLVAAFGEFGRAPRIDQGAGRGHWPGAMATLLAGGGIRGGQIIGSTTSNGGEPKDRPLGPGDLLASIYRVVGVDHQATVRDRQSRPIPILESGEPIAELF
jgi:uncharacterized protein DUF1501